MKTRVAAVLLALFAGCAASDLPSRLPDPEEAMNATTGSYTVVSYLGMKLPVGGELIAVDRDTVHLLTWAGMVSVPKSQVVEAKVFVTDVPISPGGASGLLVLGVLSTAANGGWAIYTAPLWLVFGTMFVSAYASSMNDGDLRYPDVTWKHVAPFARLPQGLPRAVDRGTLRYRLILE